MIVEVVVHAVFVLRRSLLLDDFFNLYVDHVFIRRRLTT
jgi:hypothetical protein